MNFSFFPLSICRGLPSVFQPAAPVMPRQWSFRSLPRSKHCLSKCPERYHGHHTKSLTITDSTSTPAPISVFSISSTSTAPPNPASSAELFPGPTNLPAATTATHSESKSAVISDKLLPSTSTASHCTVSPPALQVHLLWLFVPTGLLASPQLLLGAGGESPALCAAPPCPL